MFGMGLALGACMTQPRMRIAGATVMLTRTIANRRFLLRPSEVVNEVISYCLFAAASKCGVLIHSIAVMMDHLQYLALSSP